MSPIDSENAEKFIGETRAKVAVAPLPKVKRSQDLYEESGGSCLRVLGHTLEGFLPANSQNLTTRRFVNEATGSLQLDYTKGTPVSPQEEVWRMNERGKEQKPETSTSTQEVA